jgi:ABC-type molybdenum transport system ATPase subunit/photorepair protein PhrA
MRAIRLPSRMSRTPGLSYDHVVNPNVPVARIEVGAFRRDGVEILRGVQWTIDRGQHWAILGPNGSGKTSLARILGAYEWPSDGAG